MCQKIENFFVGIYEYIKRAFGRSRTIAIQVFGGGSAIFVEMSDQLTNFNLDDFFKHEVAAGITLVVSVLTILARLDTNSAVSFAAKPVEPVLAVEPVPVPVVEEAQSPKAE